MRAYFFGNYYLSSIQQGIQAQHCTTEMFVKYHSSESVGHSILHEWAKNHKTTIVLNGGNSSDLGKILEFIRDGEYSNQHAYPFASFNEDAQSLNQALTCVGIILPDIIYSTAEDLRDKNNDVLLGRLTTNLDLRGIAVLDWDMYNKHPDKKWFINRWELELITKFLNMCSLAR
jgi:hypothetical protein